MITVESKLELFNKVVLEKMKKERRDVIDTSDRQREELLASQKVRSTKKADDFLKAIIDEAYEDKKAMLARAKSDLKRQVLTQRQLLIDHLADAVLRRFEAFVDEASYRDYLEGLVHKHQSDLEEFGAFTVVLEATRFERDKALIMDALTARGLKAKDYLESEDHLVGGCVFYKESQDVLIDGSLLSLIEEHRIEIGQRMYVMLNEVGDQSVF